MTFILLTFLFLALVGFFSGIEVGLVSLLPARVQHGVRLGQRGAWILAFFMRHPGYLLATTLVGTNLCLVGASNTALRAMTECGFGGPAAFLAMTCIMTLLLLTVEIVPKDWFRQSPYARCRLFAYPLYAAFWLLWPAVTLSAKFTGLVNRLFGGRLADDDTARGLMREDFRILLRESEKHDLIDAGAANLLERSLDFHRLRVADICRRREDVLQLAADLSLAEAMARCRERNLSRAPVAAAGDAGAPWCGVFNVYDAMFAFPEEEWDRLRVGEALRPLVTVAADRHLEEVLVRAKQSHAALLVVTAPDRPERHLGIVTPADVARVLFG